MFKRYILAGSFVAIGAFILCFATVGQAQKAQKNNVSRNAPSALTGQGITAVAFAVTAPARTFPGAVVDPTTYDIELSESKEINQLNTVRVRPAVPGSAADGALKSSAKAQQGGKLSDIWNKAVPSPNAPASFISPSILLTFEGMSVNGSAPPDTNAAVGPNDIVETVNTLVQIFDKAGVPRGPAFKQSNFYKSMGGVCAATDNGDPVVLYDRLADRWVITQFGFLDFTNGPYHECIAVSKTGDPTGEYYAYDLQLPGSEFPDYPKFGVWTDAYYMTTNQFCMGASFDGAGAFAFDRKKMLVGDHSGFLGIYFNLSFGDGAGGPSACAPASFPEGIFGMLPSDHTGLLPPQAGTPNVFVYFTNVQFGDPADGLRLFNFSFVPDPNIFSSSFSESQTSYASPLPLAAFDARDPGGRGDNEQPPPATAADNLDSIGSRLMNPLHYINRNGTESLIGNFTVNITGVAPNTASTYQSGFRYFELRRFSPFSNFFVNEQSTYFINNNGIDGAAGVNSWITSIGMDNEGNIAAGWTISAANTFNPSLIFSGRSAFDPPTGFSSSAFFLFAGPGVQRGTGNRWGDYSSLSLDPVDDCTFWHANEYYTTNNLSFNWQTRIGAFKISQTCTPPSQGTLAGTITACNSGAPLSLAMVQISNGTSTTTTATSNGNYSIQLPPGDYTVNIIDPNRSCNAAGPFSVSIFDSQTTTLNACLTGVPLPTVDPSDRTLEVVTGGNNNGIIDANECNMLTVTAKNIGCAPATNVTAVLSTSTPNVTITQPNANYLDMPIDASSSNTTPFKVSTAPGFVCGTPIDFTLKLTFTGGSKSSNFSMPTCTETQPPQPFSGQLAVGDSLQTGRLGRTGTPSSCAGKGCPGPLTATPHKFDTFSFVNGPNAACITVNLTNNTGGGNVILAKAYLGSYDPTNECTNYIGDAGFSAINTSFQAPVPANATVIVVVEESGNGGFAAPTNYTGLVSGLAAAPVPGPGICKFDTKITTHAGPETHVQGSVFDQATLTTVVGGSPTATGTITFRLFGPNQSTCGGALVFMSTVTVNGDGTYTSASFTPTAPGTYRWIANYSGDSAHNPIAGMCNDANESELVQPPATSVNGSGTINSPFGGSASFIVNAKFRNGISGRVIGNIDYNDPNAGFRMTQMKITSMSFSGDCVVITGTAKIGKTRVSFVVEACDFEGGTDFYLISISNGYFASGFITSGSIEFTP